MYGLYVAKKVLYFAAHVCAVLIIVACIFGDNTENNRKKFVVIKDNAFDLVANGGHQVSELLAYFNSKDIANLVEVAEETFKPQVVENMTDEVPGAKEHEKAEINEKLAYSRYY